MEQQSRANMGPGHEGSPPGQPDRYDNDPGLDQTSTDADQDEYRARLERNWKHAAWRTEMALRLRASGHRPARPDSAF
jgi:hypothetical protein